MYRGKFILFLLPFRDSLWWQIHICIVIFITEVKHICKKFNHFQHTTLWLLYMCNVSQAPTRLTSQSFWSLWNEEATFSTFLWRTYIDTLYEWMWTIHEHQLSSCCLWWSFSTEIRRILHLLILNKVWSNSIKYNKIPKDVSVEGWLER